MAFAWSRTFYAVKDGSVYNFEAKRDRDHACNNYGFRSLPAAIAYKSNDRIKVPSWKYRELIREGR